MADEVNNKPKFVVHKKQQEATPAPAPTEKKTCCSCKEKDTSASE